ncbi:putative T7SS-secreted protein [Streptomyces sp. NPDC002076]
MTTPTYDALGFDPAPGELASVHNLVTSLTNVTKQLHDAHATLTRLGKANSAWAGDAATAFAKKTGSLPKYLATGHDSLVDATHALQGWETSLREFQTLAGRYELEAEQARKTLKAAQNDPDLQLAGKTFDTQAEADRAQQRLDSAARRVNQARDELAAIIKKAETLLTHHDEAARAAAAAIRKAAEAAPDESLLHKLGDLLSSIGDEIKSLANDLWHWIQKHADTIYKIGDWLNMAAAVCDLLAIVFSETIIGAAVFEVLARVLNAGALAFHGVGWAAGAKKGSWADIGLDLAGFVPFGDLIKGGKLAWQSFRGVEIAADSFKAADRIAAIAGKAKDAEVILDLKKPLFGAGKAMYRATADTFKGRFAMAAERVFNDATRYERPLTSPVKFLDQHVVPKIIDHTPLGKIPGLADAVKLGENGKTFIDPTSWVSRAPEVAYRGYKLYESAETAFSNEVHGKYEKYKGLIDQGLGAL